MSECDRCKDTDILLLIARRQGQLEQLEADNELLRILAGAEKPRELVAHAAKKLQQLEDVVRESLIYMETSLMALREEEG
jgi:hypothetical protein